MEQNALDPSRGINIEEAEEIVQESYGSDLKTVKERFGQQIVDAMKNFTQTAIDAGKLNQEADPRAAFIHANELGYTDGEHIEVDFTS